MAAHIEQLTLREKLRDAAHTLRELIEHLDMGFVPKVHELKKLCRQPEPGTEAPPVADSTVRSHVHTVLDSDRFTAGLVENLDKYLASIQKDVANVVSKGAGR